MPTSVTSYPRLEIRAQIETEWRRQHQDLSGPRLGQLLDTEMCAVERYRQVLIPLLHGHRVSAHHRVLDYRCRAACAATAIGYDLKAEVIGLDFDRNFETIAPRWPEAYGIQDRVAVQFSDDPPHLPFDSETFDFVVSVTGIEPDEEGDRRPAIREMVRVLKPGGRLIIADTPNGAWPREPHKGGAWLQWMPQLLNKVRIQAEEVLANRGLTFGQLLSATRDLQFVRGNTDEIQSFTTQLTDRLHDWPLVQDVTHTAVEEVLKAIDERTRPRVDRPAEAFLPTLNIAFEKKA